MHTGIVEQQKPSDEQLVFDARSGDQQAFAELCLRYRGMLLNRIFGIVRHRQDAEDVLQETLLKAYQHLQTFRGACSFSTWLLAIATNMSLMLLRKRKALRMNGGELVTEDGETLVVDFRDPAPNPEQRCMMFQTSQKLNRAVAKLSPQVQTLLKMYFTSELRLKDAAKFLGIPVATAKSRLLRARQKLRRSLKQNECWTP
jgi:RNA polymerase sigma-70 factor (ECF subfamily)